MNDYRYGFNGKENDNEVKGEGNQQDYGFRIYDPRIAKFLSVDPLTQKYPELTPYQFASNRPVDAIDLDGLEHSPASAKLMRDNTAVMRIPHPAEIEAVKRDQEYAAMHRDPPTAKLDFDYTHTIWGSKGGKAPSDEMAEYEANLVPGLPLAIKKLKNEEITTGDVVIEAVAALPIAKIAKVAKVKTLYPILEGPLHHLATNKNFKQGLQWSKKFEPIFKKAGYELDDALNKVFVPGHKGPHSEEYHQYIYDKLTTALKGLKAGK